MYTFTLLLLLLGFDLVLATASNLQGCDRGNSRDAASVISTVIQPKLAAHAFEIPDDCPLDVGKGLYSIQETHKVLMRRNVWRCAWDQKTFRGEAYIDLHMDNHHRNDIPQNAICLADLCGPLHCDFFKATSRGSLQHLATVPCHQGVMDEFRQRCQHPLVFARLELQPNARVAKVLHTSATVETGKADVQDIAHQCFNPVHGAAAEELYAFMLSNLCAAATCHWHSMLENRLKEQLSDTAPNQSSFRAPAARAMRKEILLPLAKTYSGSQYLQTLGLVAVGLVVLVIYAVIAVHWFHRSGSSRNPVMKALEAAGLVKKRVTKLV